MTEGLPLGRTEVIAGIDEIVIHIIQDIENRQNHKWKLDVACDKDKGKIRKEQTAANQIPRNSKNWLIEPILTKKSQ